MGEEEVWGRVVEAMAQAPAAAEAVAVAAIETLSDTMASRHHELELRVEKLHGVLQLQGNEVKDAQPPQQDAPPQQEQQQSLPQQLVLPSLNERPVGSGLALLATHDVSSATPSPLGSLV